MSASYRTSSATTANTGATPASSLTINTSTGAQSNDILIACISVSGGSSATITPPTGWTAILGANETTDILTRAYWRQATGYETASYTWTFDTTRQAAGVMVAYSGAYPNIPRTSTTNVNSTASTTTASGTGNSTYETGLSIQIFGAYNTSVATTMTASGGYAQRADTCTTASAFIEVAIQDNSKGLPMGGMSANAATISSAATSTSLNFMIEDQRTVGVLTVDDYLVGSKTASFSSFTSGTFPVNYPNELLLVFASVCNGATTVSGITGGGLTWANVGRINTNAGSTEVWRAFAPISQNFGLTFTMSASTVSFNFVVVGIVGADMTGTSGSGAIGAFNTATSTSAAPSVNVTTTRNNSWVWAAGNDSTGTVAAVAGTGQTLLRSDKDTANNCLAWLQRQTTATTTSGTVVTMNNTAPSTDSCNMLAVEILPAIHYNLAATGAG
jgi:hypothetical protein